MRLPAHALISIGAVGTRPMIVSATLRPSIRLISELTKSSNHWSWRSPLCGLGKSWLVWRTVWFAWQFLGVEFLYRSHLISSGEYAIRRDSVSSAPKVDLSMDSFRLYSHSRWKQFLNAMSCSLCIFVCAKMWSINEIKCWRLRSTSVIR